MKSNYKSNRAMKLTYALLIAASMGVYATGNAQTARVNIQANNVITEKVLSAIEKQTDYLFVYNKKEIDLKRKTTINAVNKTTAEVLSTMFNGTDIVYAIEGENIFLIKKKTNLQAALPSVKNVYQSKLIKGKVVDVNGVPIIGANVVIQGTTTGTITDIDGNFSLEAEKGATLVISYIGYSDFKIKIGNQKSLSITLEEDSQSLDELVVVGYGAMKKIDLVGAVSSVTSEKLDVKPKTNVQQALAGRIPGVSVSSYSGEPGGRSQIRVRGFGSVEGSNDPLVVVDGVVGVDMNLINPSDISSIDVLKDASSTAIYGARGANGVIMITTKRAKKGLNRPLVSYSGYVSIATLPKKIDLMSSSEYLEYSEKAHANNGKIAPWLPGGGDFYGSDEYKKLFDENGKPRYNTDWQDVVFGDPKVSHSHNLSIMSSKEKTNWGINVAYIDEEGLAIESFLKRLNGRVYVDSKINKWLSANGSISFNDYSTAYTGGAKDFSLVRNTIFSSPIYPESFEKGSTNIFGTNDLPTGIQKNFLRENHYNQLVTQGGIDVNIYDGLTFTNKTSMDQVRREENRYYGTHMSEKGGKGEAEVQWTLDRRWQVDNYFTYIKDFNDLHSLKFVLGSSLQKSTATFVKSKSNGYTDDFYKYHNIGVGINDETDTGITKWQMASFYGRFNYDFDKKYLATFTMRADGSSVFGDNNKWGYFPSAGLGWRLSEENFMKDIDLVSNLKLRGSYGIVGNAPKQPYVSETRISTDNYFSRLIIDNKNVSAAGVRDGKLGDSDLKWEQTGQLNVGLDFSVLNNRINLTIDSYNKQTKDLLMWAEAVPLSSGFNRIYTNIGEMENKGVELSLNTLNIDHDDFRWETTFNFSKNKNKILKVKNEGDYQELQPDESNTKFSRLQPGYSIITFQGYQFAGISDDGLKELYYNDKGEIVDNVGKAAIGIIGDGLPKWEATLINDFYYKNFALNIQFDTKQGHDIYNIQRWKGTRGGFGFKEVATNHWTPENTNTDIRQPALSRPEDRPSSRCIEDGSFVRLSNVNLSYTFPRKLVSKLKINNAYLYFNIQNLCVWSSYSGYDPEVKCYGEATALNIAGEGSYPKPRTYLLGFKFSF